MNEFEKKVRGDLIAKGCKVHRAGWPDFLVEYPDGKIKCVEVKGPNDWVREHQRLIHDVLRVAGIEVEVISIGNKLKIPPGTKKPRKLCPGCGASISMNVHGGVVSHAPCGYGHSYPNY